MKTKIKITKENLLKLLELLGDIEGDISVELSLAVSESTIGLLENYATDWEFIDTTSQPKPQNTGATKLGDYKIPQPIENSIPEQDLGMTYYTNGLGIKDYNGLATLVEAIYRLSKNSPNIKFDSGLFYNTLEMEYSEVASSTITIEHSLITMIIETYYRDSNMGAALEDTVEKLKGLWISKELQNHPSVTSVTKVLYGGTRK